MNCRECEGTLAHWLASGDAGLDPRLPTTAALKAHAAVCPACAARFEAVRGLLSGTLPPPSTPPYLAARVRARLDADAADAPRRRRLRRFRAPALGLAAGLTAAVLVLTIGLVGRRAPAGEHAGMLVRFTLEAPQADRVAVVGDWNGWDALANPLGDPDGDGIWEAEIVLFPGREYRYQFTIDGRDYVPDPGAALRIEDGFGGMNSILHL